VVVDEALVISKFFESLLPSWFVSGFLGLYAQMKFKDDTITLAPTVWGSETETRRIQRGKRSGDPVKITLLPMSEFLAGRAITEEPRDAARIHLWFAQAELFIRWALEEHEDARHAAFWKFLDRSCTEPVTEVMFRECFGAGFYEISDKLKFFVSTAISQTTTWRSAETMEDPPLELRNATGGEIARIKGEWERLEASYVRARSPVREAYLNLGRRTLRHAYDLGDRDPRLLASLGLLECDAGNEAGAREFLEPAVQGGVIRPRAYLELARLYFNTARTQPAGADDKFSADQAAAILAPLAAGGRQAPPLLETYQLIADVWAHCAAAPPPNEMATLGEGMKFFPKQAKLRQRIAELQASPPANNSGR